MWTYFSRDFKIIKLLCTNAILFNLIMKQYADKRTGVLELLSLAMLADATRIYHEILR
jgi:hypothetical protein